MSSDGTKLSPQEIVAYARRRIRQIVQWTASDSMSSYAGDEKLQAAVERNFIAIGEAIKDLSRVVDLGSFEIAGSWKDSTKFRNFLAHRYDDVVSNDDVWQTIVTDLPVLDAALDRIEQTFGQP